MVNRDSNFAGTLASAVASVLQTITMLSKVQAMMLSEYAKETGRDTGTIAT